MKKLVKMSAIGCVLIGIIMIVIGVYNIYDAKVQLEETMKAWNKLETISIDDIELVKNNSGDAATVYVDHLKNQETTLYPDVVNGDLIGLLRFADEEVPIITGKEAKLLKKGALHYSGTALPGYNSNSVILGHRDTVFSNLKLLKPDETFSIEVQNALLKFQVVDIKIIDANDESVFDYYGYPTVSLETCYPFYYFGPSPERYIVVGKLIE